MCCVLCRPGGAGCQTCCGASVLERQSCSGCLLQAARQPQNLLFARTCTHALADCCDGTDELGGCKNTCIEKNSAKRDAIKKQIDDYRAALDRKAQYASSAHGVRTNIKTRFAHVDADIVAAERELERLAGGCDKTACTGV